ncbi:MAG: glycosyltransferase family 4 protein [Pelagibacterales bacterium]|jgi:glycosyltransferase involved in cell wall biosynthesis|nr:glycosyltransferase family 4 protein [Pelagibacterales bacterium]MBL6861429.1 glycosyltransferase family 4 protein [Pelagibacterales bacterium]|tara:strand:+ start:692 stop:1837 length:1146 start_codon:yes stop_codon:yes gene_type:complete
MQEKPNILQVIPTLNISGAEQGCFDVANYLTKNGFTSNIITSSGYRIEQLEKNGSIVNRIPVHSKNPLTIIINIFRIIKIVKKNNINIIHARSRAPAWSCYFVAKIAKIKFITTFHGTYNFNNKIKKFYNSIMIRSDYIIAISEFIHNEIKSKYAYSKKNLSVISRGIDIEYLDPSKTDYKKVKKIIKDHDIKNDSIKLVLPGRVSGWKGHNVAIEAMAHLKDKSSNDFELIFVGPADNLKLKNNLLQKISELKLENCVKFVGPSKEMNLVYSLADIVLSCSTDPEAFGRIPVEAQAMGKVIIASNHGGHTETIINGLSGFLYSPLSSEELANLIIKTISSEIYLEDQYRIKRRQIILDKFTDLNMCKKTLEVYNKVLRLK